MAQASIPVDLLNPGQVFACLGFLEVADVLSGHAEAGFDWTNEAEPRFDVHVKRSSNPFCSVLQFLSEAHLVRLAPAGYTEAHSRKKAGKRRNEADRRRADDAANDSIADGPLCTVETFPGREVDRHALPVRLERNGQQLDLTHWCDASSRNAFKLFAGQQRSGSIARQMLAGIRQLWNDRQEDLILDPFGLTAPLGGSSFKLDARKAWTAIDAGYSPDEQAHAVQASPVVEMLAAIGLEHARPDEFETREVRYAVWKAPLVPPLARPALGGMRVGVPIRRFRFTLDLAGKNKIVTFAREETNP